MYKNFADIYDALMYDVDYKGWADYVEEIFRRHGVRPGLVLDLGCGTGSFCIEMAARGYDMIGVDLSPEMLSCAKTKTVEKGLDILYLNQDMTDFELYGTVGAIVCLMDSINYITAKNSLKRLLKLVNNYLDPGGLFVFDINTRYKFEKVFGENVFYDVSDDVTYIWKNNYDGKRKVCEFDLTFFIKDGDRYIRQDETHYERAYAQEEIKEMLGTSDLRLLEVCDELSFKAPCANSQRVFYTCRKPGSIT